MPIDIRTSDRDILTLVYRGEFTDADYDVALRTMTTSLEVARKERRKIGLVSIGTDDSNMSSRQRQRSAAWLKDEAALLRAACVGQAVVVPGTLQRGVLTAILWMGEHPVPIKACATEDEALRWVRPLLAAAADRSARP